jgi:hypothetical protein
LLKAGLLSEMRQTQPSRSPATLDTALIALYALALSLSISAWFLAIRAPFWLDETISLFIVKHGFSQIFPRQGWPGVPAYPYILCLWIKAVGAGEIALRISSIAAMLGAAYLLYRAARELFARDVSIIAAIVFCLHPVVVAEAIDIRPYAFAALVINASIFVLVRLRQSDSVWLAALFAFLATSIVYFQFLFAVALPALALCFFCRSIGDRKAYWRQTGVALVIFVIAFLPVIPGMLYMFHSSGVHVFETAPTLGDLARALGQKRQLIVLAAVGLLAAAARKLDVRKPFDSWPALLSLSLALLPILLLWGVSTATSIHIFVARYRLVAVPGIALCWALVISRIDSRALRALFCAAFVTMSAWVYYHSPTAREHDYSWKYALEFAQKNASRDNAPVLICSDLPESDHSALPTGAAVKDSALFAPLAYYPLSVPVIALPRALNDDAKRIGLQFLQEVTPRHQRFLAVAYEASYDTVDWIQDAASETYDVRELGIFDRVEVVEFLPENH